MYCKKINNEIIEPIKLPTDGQKPLKGHDIFSIPYCNAFLVAKKKSGKTCTIFKILKSLAGKKTQIIVFCSTFYNDASWVEINKHFEKKKINVIPYTSIYENGLNQIEEFIDGLTDEAKIPDEDLLKTEIICVGNSEIHTKIKKEFMVKKEKKHDYVDYILVADDLSSELKDKAFASLLKKNRHFKMVNVLSSQYYLDLDKSGRMNVDYILIWGGQPEEKLRSIHKESDMSISFEDFKKMYDMATAEKYKFLYCDIRNDKFRICFDKEIIL